MDNQFEKEITDVAHKSWWQTFEVVFGIPFFAAIALHFAVPLSLPKTLITPAIILGGILIATGSFVVILARRKFTRHSQPTDPGRPSSKLITTGIFSISRNPFYLGGVGIVAGLALVLNLSWVLVSLPLTLVACYYLLIAPEEQYLTTKFGSYYHDYTATVHRWIGHSKHGDS